MCDKNLLRETPVSRPRQGGRNSRHVLINAGQTTTETNFERSKTRVKLIVAVLVTIVIVSALCGYLINSSESTQQLREEPPDPVVQPPPSSSQLHVFKKSAVCTDAPQCSQIGSDILQKNGSAVDAAIAAMACNGLLNMQSMGIGGGFFMTVYIKAEKKAYAVIAREKAPAAATADMYHGDFDKASAGPLAVAVPGEVRGMWAAHQRWGVLPWAEVLAPTLAMCREGFILSKAMRNRLLRAPYCINDSNLRQMYYDETRKDFYAPGTLLKPYVSLCDTLDQIAAKGGDDLYNGSLAVDFADDLQKVGSIITAEDLKNYQPKITAPISVPLRDGDTLYAPPPPSSGILLAYILNIVSGFNFTADSISTIDKTILTYQRIIEAFKYAYATRTKLGDGDFLNLDDLMQNISSVEFALATQLKINDSITSNDTATYGATEYTKDDGGTAHMSIIAPNGDAVSVTSSINNYFGAGFTTFKTGIVMNNIMDDFSSPGITNSFGLQPSPANFIEPGKRPLSSMSPSIIVDKAGNAKLVIGASGGTKITTAIAQVAIRKLWFHQSLKEAIDEPRIHHQIFPMKFIYEYGLPESIVNGLKAKGHAVQRYFDHGSIVCALYRNATAIYANADFRKGGDVVGLN